MSGNIDRIMAQKDMRSLTVANAAASQEGAKQCRERLIVEAGTIVKAQHPALTATRDEAGFSELKELAGQLG